jgi:broad specificity phosphatase PhoE
VLHLLLIRHGATRWNEARLLQGRADPGLSKRGRAEVQAWRLPPGWRDASWYASPLRRARETAELLSEGPVAIDPRLIEMDWGAFERRRLADLRADDPLGLAENEARGLDFRPPGGESPREVAARLQEFIAALPGPAVAVTHKGVIRAALALATGWDMRRLPPVRPRRDQALHLMRDEAGRLALAGPPVSLVE